MPDTKPWVPNPIDNDNSSPMVSPTEANEAYRKAMGDSTPLVKPGKGAQDGKLPEDCERRANAMNAHLEYMICKHRRLMNLIGEVLQEAQENPQRLVAFNSPLLGLLLMEYHAHISDGKLDVRACEQLRSVIKARGAP